MTGGALAWVGVTETGGALAWVGVTMTGGALAWVGVTDAVAAIAAGRLWRAASRSEPAVRDGYRWLAVGAACWAVGGTAQRAFSGLIGGTSPLRVADLISLAVLPALVIGVATLTGGPSETEESRPALGTPGAVADSWLLVAALFVIGWVAIFGMDYGAANAGAGAFALDLLHPMADLVALGLLVPLAARAPRLALPPAAALVLLTIGDSLNVAARAAGSGPGAAAQLAWIAGLVVLAGIPGGLPGWLDLRARVSRGGTALDRRRRPRPSALTVTALASAGVAAAAIIGYSLGGGLVAPPVLGVAGGGLVLLLVLRIGAVVRRAAAVPSAAEPDRMFRALAERTSDAVLICELSGAIRYASPAVADYGYRPADLAGTRLADLVHPEDRQASRRAALAGLRSGGTSGTAAGTATFAGRIKAADGSWRQVQATLSRYGAPVPPDLLLVTARDLSDRVALRRQLTQLTFHDGLTGLPNRAFVEERVRAVAAAESQPTGRPAPPTGVILLHLDGYAQVSEEAGHGVGDLLLAQAGRRLRSAAPHEATVARWGGDEFAVLLTATSGAEATELGERLAGLIGAEPFSAGGADIAIAACAGVAVTGFGTAVRDLLPHADLALAEAKAAGDGRVELFAEPMTAGRPRRQELAAELRQAIAEQRLVLEYQPIADLRAGHAVAVEALVRWPRADRPAGPAELLAVAEDSGLLGQLGNFVLGAACRQVAARRRDGWPVGLVLCVPRRYAGGPVFNDAVLAALAEAGLAPGELTLALSEHVPAGRVLPGRAQPDWPHAADARSGVPDLALLRERGVRVGIDNFGISNSPLAELRALAPDVIRLDPSFVAGLGDDPVLAGLTRAIVRLGRELRIDVVACGISAPGQLEQLTAMGCGLGQGPAIGMPMAADQVAERAPDGVRASAPAPAT